MLVSKRKYKQAITKIVLLEMELAETQKLLSATLRESSKLRKTTKKATTVAKKTAAPKEKKVK